MATQFDIVINGGGMVGLTLAALLQDSFSIAVIDPTPLADMVSVSDDTATRVSAISPASQSILEQAGAWDRITAHRAAPYQHMHVWDSNGSEALDFSAQQVAASTLGYIIENQVLRSGLAESLQIQGKVQFYATHLDDAQPIESAVKLRLASGDRIQARLLIGADGARSWVRDKFDFATREHAYQQKAFVANVRVEQVHQMTAWQRFLPTGPVALLPLADPHQCSVVWTVTDELHQQLDALDDTQFAKRLAAAFDYRLGDVALITERVSFPLVAKYAEQYVQQRVVLIGDAAHAIHPLAGQGVNLGFLDAHQLAKQLVADPAISHRHLRQYERTRKAHNRMVQESMTVIQNLYRSENPLIVMARNIGVAAIRKIPMAKQAIIKQAMGWQQLT